MSLPAPDTCLECGSVIDTALLGGVCPRCLLGDVVGGSPSARDVAFDGHELLGEIARGGMGVVYRARQLEPERIVALKTLRGASLDSTEARARFKHEAEVMVALDHPAILPVHHFGEEDGIPFFTMKLADGGTLVERVDGLAGKWREIAALMVTLCDAVRHAHERGVLHRDLKPGNVLFDAAGQAYVSDFGIAKLTNARDAMTLTMSVLGTPHYLAPEVAHQGPKAASVSSDVWSLGVILFELLTGRRPFEGESVTMLLRALDANDAPSVSTLRKDVPRDLAVITGKALQREPAQRYASAHELASDLTAWLEGRPIQARAVPALERAWLWSKRNPLLAGAAVLVILASLGAVAALAYGFETARKSETQTRMQLREALLSQAKSGRSALEVGWRASGLKALTEANAIGAKDEIRDEMIAHLVGYDVEVDKRQFAGNAFFSPDAELYVTTLTASAEVEVRRVRDHAPLFRANGLGPGNNLAGFFDPRGRRVAMSCGVSAAVFALPDGRELQRWPRAFVIDHSADGEWLVLNDGAGQRVVRTADWSVVGPPPGGHRVVRLKPDDPAKVLVLENQQMTVRDALTDERLCDVPISGTAFGAGWCADGVVASCNNGVMQGYDLRRKRTAIYAPQFIPAWPYAALEGGALLLTSGGDSVTQLWHASSGTRLLHAEGIQVREVLSDRIALSVPASTLARIAHSSAWRLVPERVLLAPAPSGRNSMALSDDGTLLLAADNRTLVIHEVASGALLAHVEQPATAAAMFVRGGREVAVACRAGLIFYDVSKDAAGHLRLDQKRALPLLADARSIVSCMRLGATDRLLLFTQDGHLFVLAEDGSSFVSWTRASVAQMNSAAISADTRFMVCPQKIGYAVQPMDGSGKPVEMGIGGHIGRASFSPDGGWIAFVDNYRQVSIHAAPDWRLAHQFMLPSEGHSRMGLGQLLDSAWSPDSRWFAVASSANEIVVIETGTWRVLATLRGPLRMPSVSLNAGADAASLFVQRRDGSMEIWDLASLSAELKSHGVSNGLPDKKPVPVPVIAGPFKAITLPQVP